jgi:hypothetical protein
MKNKISGYLLAVGMGAIFASGVHFFLRKNAFEEQSLLIVLILYTVLLLLSAFIWCFFERDNDQTEALKSSQAALDAKIHKTLDEHAQSLKQAIKQGSDYLNSAGRGFYELTANYHARRSAYQGLVRYYVYAAATKSLKYNPDAEIAEKFVRKELDILQKIEAGENVYELAGGRAHAQEQAYNTLLGRVVNGTAQAKTTAFYKCKNCGAETETCLNCGGELERKFRR